MSTNDTPSPQLMITLVHGTWPRGVIRDVFLRSLYGTWPRGYCPNRLWFAEGSKFRNGLTAALSKCGFSAQISAFRWSGANSVRERDNAGRQLAEHIRVRQLNNTSPTHVLIAHSHGGNVALRALEHLGDEGGGILVATLSTPFVEIVSVEASDAEKKQISYVALAFAIGLTLLSLMLLFSPFLFYYEQSNASGPTVLIFSMIVAVIGGLIIGAPIARRMNSVLDRFILGGKSVQLGAQTAISSFVRRHPILVIRTVDDEAALTLAAGAIGNRLSRFLTKWLFRMFFVLSTLAWIVMLPLLVNEHLLPNHWKSPLLEDALTPMTVFEFYLLAIMSLAFASMLLPGLCKAFYGRELLFGSGSCEINSHSAPDSVAAGLESQPGTASSWGTVVTIHERAVTRPRLRHGLYDAPQCPGVIANWLRRRLASA